MTPRELRAEFAAAHRRQTDEYDRDTVQAWRLVHIYFRTKKDRRMPPLKSLLSATRAVARPKSIAEQRGVLEQLSAQYRIPLRRRKG
jgi:succinylarginine dihydrolase